MKRSIRYTLLSAVVLTSVSAALPVLNVKADVEEPTSETTEVNNETIDSYISLPGLGHEEKKIYLQK